MRNKKIIVLFALMMLMGLFQTAKASIGLDNYQSPDSSFIQNESTNIYIAFRRGGGRSIGTRSRVDNSFSHGGMVNPGYKTKPITRDYSNTRESYSSARSGYINSSNNIRKDTNLNHTSIYSKQTEVNVDRSRHLEHIPPGYIHPIPRPPIHPDWHYNHYHRGDYWHGYWRGYSYRYPWGLALGTAVATLPMTIAILASSDSGTTKEYNYNEGIYYVQSDNGYQVTQPPPGIEVPDIPEGFFSLKMNGNQYYYYFGTYYVLDQVSNKYRVVQPPVGAIVPYLPDGYGEQEIAGQTVLTVGSTYYVPEKEEDTTVFKVIDPNSFHM